MNKIKVGTSVIILLVLCLFFHNFLVLLNYFLALFLHELAHLIVATKRGYTLRQFRIDLFGMAIDIDSDIESKDSFIVNIAGPMLNLILCGVCVAMYYLFPMTYVYFNTFCIANFSLAIFNLLPIYPLDGGKIFRGMMSVERYKRCDFVIRVALGSIFSLLFICSLPQFNWFYLLFVIFLINTRERDMSISRKKDVVKFTIKRLDENIDIYTTLKQVNNYEYSVFYVGDRCFVEDSIYELALKYPLNSKLVDIT